MLHQLLLYIIDEPTCGNDQPATSPQEASLNESPTFLSFAIGLKSVKGLPWEQGHICGWTKNLYALPAD